MADANLDTVDFSNASALVVSENKMTRTFLLDTVRGFGFGVADAAENIDQAMTSLQRKDYALILVDTPKEPEDALEFVRWLRVSGLETNFYKPVMLTAANVTSLLLDQARDAGFNFVMVKPVAPDALMKRLQWIAKHDREFITTDTYHGPDRRFRFEGPPPGMAGRRASDLSATIGNASDPNMEQDEIDALFKPQKISL